MNRPLPIVVISLILLNSALYCQNKTKTKSSQVWQQVKRFAPILVFSPREGKHCCYPSDAAKAYQLLTKNKLVKNVGPKQFNSKAPCYFQYSRQNRRDKSGQKYQIERIKYWFWYNHNDAPNSWFIGDHIADWESIEIVLINGQLKLAILSCHENQYARYCSPAQLTLVNKTKVKAWVALGSHAHYESTTTQPYQKKFPFYTWQDVIEDSNTTWDTGANLIDWDSTPFAEYQGKWVHPVSPGKRQFEHNIEKFLKKE